MNAELVAILGAAATLLTAIALFYGTLATRRKAAADASTAITEAAISLLEPLKAQQLAQQIEIVELRKALDAAKREIRELRQALAVAKNEYLQLKYCYEQLMQNKCEPDETLGDIPS